MNPSCCGSAQHTVLLQHCPLAALALLGAGNDEERSSRGCGIWCFCIVRVAGTVLLSGPGKNKGYIFKKSAEYEPSVEQMCVWCPQQTGIWKPSGVIAAWLPDQRGIDVGVNEFLLGMDEGYRGG